MIIANFINKQDALVTGLDQYDYGQILRIQGLKLPTAVEIHFGLEETGGTTTTRIGVTKDGVTDVPIPDSMLENGDTSLDYTIYAFVYLTDETSGKTTNKIKIQVKARSKPEQFDKPSDTELFHKAIEAVNQSAKEAEGWAHGREDMPERAEDNAKYYSEQASGSAEEVKKVEQSVKDMVATVDGIEQQVQDVKEYAGQAQSASEEALLAEQEAKKSEGAALQHRTGAETAENNAEVAEQNAKKSEQAVEQAKQLVMQMGQEVLQNKNQVDEKVEAFNKVVTDAVDAVGTAKTDAVDAVETAGTEQTKKVADEGAKQVKAVEDKGNEVLQSIPQDFTTQMASKLDKQQGAENKGKALVVGEDGNVTVGEATGGDGIPIINTMSGESPLVVPDSAERVNKGFSLIGKSEQVTTTGKNLFDEKKLLNFDDPNYDKSNSSKGIFYYKFKIDEQVTVSVTKLNKDGEYLCVGAEPDGSDTHWLCHKSAATNTFKTLTPKDGYIYLGVNTTLERIENMIRKTGGIMINHGSVAMPYEPYTGGKPSPSPDYPQEIKNVGKWNPETQKYEVGVRVTGNNILNTQIEPDTKGIYQGWKVGDGKKKITLSIIDKVNNKDISDCYFGLSGNGTDQKDGVVWCIENGKIAKTKITSLNPYVTIFPSDETTQRKILERFDIQCEFGEIKTEYQPYKEQTLTLTSDRPITKWDKLVEQDGQIGWLYQSKEIVLNGSETEEWRKTGINDVYQLYMFDGTYKDYEVFCDKLVNYKASVNHITENSILANTNYLYVRISGITDIQTLRDFLNSNNLKVVYYSKTQEFIPLPQDEQNAIRALKTYYPTTVITTDGGEVNPDVEVTYIADTKNYIDQKIAAIGKTVVETQKALL